MNYHKLKSYCLSLYKLYGGMFHNKAVLFSHLVSDDRINFYSKLDYQSGSDQDMKDIISAYLVQKAHISIQQAIAESSEDSKMYILGLLADRLSDGQIRSVPNLCKLQEEIDTFLLLEIHQLFESLLEQHVDSFHEQCFMIMRRGDVILTHAQYQRLGISGQCSSRSYSENSQHKASELLYVVKELSLSELLGFFYTIDMATYIQGKDEDKLDEYGFQNLKIKNIGDLESLMVESPNPG